jgi:hypothetical protein
MKQLFRLVIPKKAEVFVFISGGLLLLLLQNIKHIWSTLSGGAAVLDPNTLGTGNTFVNHLKSLEGQINPRLVDFTVWLLLGCFAYIVISFLVALLKSADDEVELIHYYKFPKGRSHEINAFLTKLALRFAGLLGIVVWLSIFLKTVNPYLTQLFFTSTTLNEPASWLWLPYALVFYAASLYLFAVLIRLVFLKPRVFGEASE